MRHLKTGIGLAILFTSINLMSLTAQAGSTFIEEQDGVCRLRLKPDTGQIRDANLMDMALLSRENSENAAMQVNILLAMGYEPSRVTGSSPEARAFRQEKLSLLYTMAIDETLTGSPRSGDIGGDCQQLRHLSSEINVRAYDPTAAPSPVER